MKVGDGWSASKLKECSAAQGEILFEFHNRFSIRRVAGDKVQRWIFRDGLSPRSSRAIEVTMILLDTTEERRAALRMFVPPCIEHSPLPVRARPETISDSHFWQFPAVTEQLAFERHAELLPPDWRSADVTPIHTFLGLPWASYIDKQCVPDVVKQVLGVRLRGYRALAAEWGLEWGQEIKVHTVCQHIYWERLLPFWAELGVTDVHLSHCEPGSAAVAGRHGMKAHSWALAAANVVNPERREGLEFGRRVEDRQWLASFVGAYMPHYRSDVRLRLRDEAAREADVVFELTDDWHFNPAVYEDQVKGKPLSAEQVSVECAAVV